MKKTALLFALTMMFFGLTAQASIGTDDCPIRNLRKSGVNLNSPGLAFFPKGHPMNLQNSNDALKPKVYREN